MSNKYNNNQKGFTLIETFVAIVILLIVVLGPMSMLSKALAENNSLKNKMAAGYLSQEGIELMIALRNYRPDLIGPGCYNEIYYNNVYSAAPSFSCDPVILNSEIEPSSNMIIGYHPGGVGIPSIFSRIIKVENIQGNEYKITSKVFWNDHGQNPDVTLITNIFR
ncbi:MAG: prepilin-type N-terminal cleavage/methylation domain-containing protein [Candidatus Paceibacterota bacterium]|jgi:prepilin-type N-terminal cleavage/methylation domain-containing protein